MHLHDEANSALQTAPRHTSFKLSAYLQLATFTEMFFPAFIYRLQSPVFFFQTNEAPHLYPQKSTSSSSRTSSVTIQRKHVVMVRTVPVIQVTCFNSSPGTLGFLQHICTFTKMHGGNRKHTFAKIIDRETCFLESGIKRPMNGANRRTYSLPFNTSRSNQRELCLSNGSNTIKHAVILRVTEQTKDIKALRFTTEA